MCDSHRPEAGADSGHQHAYGLTTITEGESYQVAVWDADTDMLHTIYSYRGTEEWAEAEGRRACAAYSADPHALRHDRRGARPERRTLIRRRADPFRADVLRGERSPLDGEVVG